jgi:hypothetical protein
MRTLRSIVLASSVLCTAFAAHANDTCPTGVSRHNGSSWLVVAPRVHNVYVGDYWNHSGYTSRQYIEGAWSFLASQPSYWARLIEYGITGGSWGGSVTSAPGWANGNGVYDDSWFTSEINQRIGDGSLSYYGDHNDLYVVYLPPGITSKADLQNGVLFWGGHHDSYTDYYGRKVWYAVVESGSDTALASHEIVETATDPTFDGYYSPQGLEIGDLCEPGYGTASSSRLTFTWPGTGYLVEDVFSEVVCGCFQVTRPTPVDPCAKLPPEERTCCKKPYLPMCKNRE